MMWPTAKARDRSHIFDCASASSSCEAIAREKTAAGLGCRSIGIVFEAEVPFQNWNNGEHDFRREHLLDYSSWCARASVQTCACVFVFVCLWVLFALRSFLGPR